MDARCWWDRLHREIREALLDARQRGLKRRHDDRRRRGQHVVLNAKYHAQEAEFRRPGRPERLGHDRHDTGGPRHRYSARRNPEFMARQQCLAEEIAERLRRRRRFVDDEQYVYFFHLDAFYRVPKAHYEPIYEHFKAQTDAEHDEVVALSGLHILATERHEARRIDTSSGVARDGRASRVRRASIYRSRRSHADLGSDRISSLMQKLGMEEGVPSRATGWSPAR